MIFKEGYNAVTIQICFWHEHQTGGGRAIGAEYLDGCPGADAIVTVCPMCQMNLEGFQKSVAKGRNEDLSITVLYLPQLLGLAMGLSTEAIMLHKNLAVAEAFLEA